MEKAKERKITSIPTSQLKKQNYTSYLDNKVFQVLCRPQYESACSIASLTAAIRYLYPKRGILKQSVFATKIGINNITSYNFNPGNRKIVEWVTLFASQTTIAINSDILFEGGWKYSSVNDKAYWKQVKEGIIDKDSFFIMHIEGHYLPIIGFGEYPQSPDSSELDGDYWLILADHSKYHSESRIPNQHWRCSPPIWSIRWGQVRKEFSNNDHYGIIKISKK